MNKPRRIEEHEEVEKELEARDGIGLNHSQLQDQYALFYWLINHNRLNRGIPVLTLLVSVLVSVSASEFSKILLFNGLNLEARGGIEPPDRAFAELGLTTWLPRHSNRARNLNQKNGCRKT